MWATTRTVTLQGALGHVIDVQVDVSPGVVATSMVGRPDTAITESRDRCRAAIENSGFHWPTNKRLTILLSPADVPKRGPHFDLAIAIGLLAAADPTFPRGLLVDAALVGELTLDGRLRCVPGVLPMTMAAKARGLRTVYVPEPQLGEAALVPDMAVIGVRSLAQAVAVLSDEPVPEAPPVEPLGTAPLLSWRGAGRRDDVDLGDVLGMPDARFALEVAATGGHHLMLSGPKGAGKTTLAERIPGLLPDLAPDEALELTAINSLAGTLRPGEPVVTRPPFRAPHHSASRAGVLGGGSGRVRPGEVSRAHLGVLLLDEFPLFPADVIDALREPLESGEISISRGEEDAVFPARSMVVFACNPCPCGNYHPHRRDNRCDCPEVRRRDYRRKLNGPILDRVDITRYVEPLPSPALADRFAVNETSAVVRSRVTAARARQLKRYAGHDFRLNAHVPGPVMKTLWPLDDQAAQRLQAELLSGRLTQRGAVRVHRVAWSVADLRAREVPGLPELDVALRLRRGDPLELADLPMAGVG